MCALTDASRRDGWVTSELRAGEPRVVAGRVDLERDGLLRSADGSAEDVKEHLIAEVKLSGIPLVQSVAGHALGLHADNLRLGVDMTDGGEQQEAAEDGEQHHAAGGQQHLECRCWGLVRFVVRCGSSGVGGKRDLVLCGKVEVLEGKRLVNLIFSKQTVRAQPQLVNRRAKDLVQTEVKKFDCDGGQLRLADEQCFDIGWHVSGSSGYTACRALWLGCM